MSNLTHPSRKPAADPHVVERLRLFARGLRADLILLLGEDCRDEIERMTVEQLIKLKGRTMTQLMAAPDPAA